MPAPGPSCSGANVGIPSGSHVTRDGGSNIPHRIDPAAHSDRPRGGRHRSAAPGTMQGERRPERKQGKVHNTGIRRSRCQRVSCVSPKLHQLTGFAFSEARLCVCPRLPFAVKFRRYSEMTPLSHPEQLQGGRAASTVTASLSLLRTALHCAGVSEKTQKTGLSRSII